MVNYTITYNATSTAADLKTIIESGQTIHTCSSLTLNEDYEIGVDVQLHINAKNTLVFDGGGYRLTIGSSATTGYNGLIGWASPLTWNPGNGAGDPHSEELGLTIKNLIIDGSKMGTSTNMLALNCGILLNVYLAGDNRPTDVSTNAYYGGDSDTWDNNLDSIKNVITLDKVQIIGSAYNFGYKSGTNGNWNKPGLVSAGQGGKMKFTDCLFNNTVFGQGASLFAEFVRCFNNATTDTDDDAFLVGSIMRFTPKRARYVFKNCGTRKTNTSNTSNTPAEHAMGFIYKWYGNGYTNTESTATTAGEGWSGNTTLADETTRYWKIPTTGDDKNVRSASAAVLKETLNTGSNSAFSHSGIDNEGTWSLNFSGSSGGDPYIFPLKSNIPVKLPNTKAVYRMFEQGNTFINAQVDRASPEHMFRMIKYAEKLTPVTHNIVTDGFFYSKFFIHAEGHGMLIDLVSKKVNTTEEGKKFFTMKQLKTRFDDGEFNDDALTYRIKWNVKNYGRVSLDVLFFPNPHIENGIKIRVGNLKNATGMLIDNYKPKLMKLPSVSTLKYDKLHRRLANTENLFQKKTIKGKNEKWHFKK